MRWLLIFIIAANGTVCAFGQSAGNTTVSHPANSVRVEVSSPRPLAEALRAISEEYGWIIDYQGPIFGDSSAVTEGRKRHLPISRFVVDLPEPSLERTSEESALERIVQVYNESDPPAKYSVRAEAQSRYLVIADMVRGSGGAYETVVPIFDHKVSLSVVERSAHEALLTLYDALHEAAGVRIVEAGFVNSALLNTRVSIGGENISGQRFLLEILNAMPQPQVLMSGYDPEHDLYVVNIAPAARIALINGKRTRVPLKHHRESSLTLSPPR